MLIGSAWGTMLAVGAALGGLVAATLGRDAAFVINAASFGASALLVVGIHRSFSRHGADGAHHERPRGGLRGVRDSLGVVVRFARGNRTLAALLLSKTTFGVGTGVIVMLAVFGRDVFNAGDAGIGMLFAARGLGALIGPFLARSLVGLTRPRAAARASPARSWPWRWATCCCRWRRCCGSPGSCVFVAHLGGGSQWMLSSYGLQRASPDQIRGRVFSFDYGLVTLTIAISFLIAGSLAEVLPPAATIWIMVGLAAIAALGWLSLARPIIRGPAHALPAVDEDRESVLPPNC